MIDNQRENLLGRRGARRRRGERDAASSRLAAPDVHAVCVSRRGEGGHCVGGGAAEVWRVVEPYLVCLFLLWLRPEGIVTSRLTLKLPRFHWHERADTSTVQKYKYILVELLAMRTLTDFISPFFNKKGTRPPSHRVVVEGDGRHHGFRRGARLDHLLRLLRGAHQISSHRQGAGGSRHLPMLQDRGVLLQQLARAALRGFQVYGGARVSDRARLAATPLRRLCATMPLTSPRARLSCFFPDDRVRCVDVHP